MSTMTPQKTFAEHSARTTQTLPTNNGTQASLGGNSRSLDMQADNRSTHHRNHPPDAQKEEAAEEEEEVEEEEEMAEEDYLLQQDQACSLHTDEPLTQNS
jgi:hypothetical protein